MMKTILLPPAVGITALLAVELVLAYLMNRLPDPDAYMNLFCMLSALLSGGACGLCAVRLTGRTLPWCVLSPLLMTVLYVIISLALPGDSGTDTAYKTVVMLCVMAGSVTFGLLGRKKQPRRR